MIIGRIVVVMTHDNRVVAYFGQVILNAFRVIKCLCNIMRCLFRILEHTFYLLLILEYLNTNIKYYLERLILDLLIILLIGNYNKLTELQVNRLLLIC